MEGGVEAPCAERGGLACLPGPSCSDESARVQEDSLLIPGRNELQPLLAEGYDAPADEGLAFHAVVFEFSLQLCPFSFYPSSDGSGHLGLGPLSRLRIDLVLTGRS